MNLINKSVAVAFSLLLTIEPMSARDLWPLSGSDTPVWTDQPMRIDRTRQSYERVPGFKDDHFLKFRVSPAVKVHDGASFSIGGQIYIVAKAIGMRPDKSLCRNDRGAVFACGGQSRAYLRKLITGRYLECKSQTLAQSTRLVDCRLGRDDLAERLVLSGFAHAAPGSGLSGAEQRAVTLKAGIWADPTCRDKPATC